MRLRFNEAKAMQAGAVLLQLRGGRMKYLKLIKLLYIADREALKRWGKPITTDRYVSMKEGPVVSNVYNLIRSEPMPDDQGIWHKHIKTLASWEVQLLGDPSNDELSQAEEDLLREIYERYGHKNRWEIVEETHKFPEWKDPGDSSIQITYRDILKAVKENESEISSDLEELKAMIVANRILQPL